MNSARQTPQAGHKFLARLGKKRLRPGGKKATEWLFSQAALQPGDQVLEIACNRGTTAVEMAQRFHCQVIGIDMDQQALAQAAQLIAAKQLDHLVQVQQADATKLPFADETFDVLINEAMLTMYADKAKQKLLKEYWRVLKTGGRLLTHDIALLNNQQKPLILEQMRQAIHVNAQPLTQDEWLTLFSHAGFRQLNTSSGTMTLLSPAGLIYDEGLSGALTIFCKALKAENRQQFFTMFRHFRRHRADLNYLAIACIK